MSSKTGVLLINLGTPDQPTIGHVRSYLSEFLNDGRVIDIPWILRKILVNLIIVPFRAGNSTKIYKKVWTDQGSPLLFHSKNAAALLQQSLGDKYEVFLAMRYKNPSIANVLAEMKRRQFSRIIVLPMFPHYASATTGSAHQEVMRIVSKWWVIPELKFISQYYDHPDFIEGFAERGRAYNLNEYDHILFSYHGLPERQVDKVYEEDLCKDHHCEAAITDENKFCYKATCYETTRLIAGRLGINADQYTVCFQSRLDKKWLEPFSDKVIESLAAKGAKKVLVFSPAFTADCLETIVEIGEEYQEIFTHGGGEKVQLVESLNSHPKWIQCLHKLVTQD